MKLLIAILAAMSLIVGVQAQTATNVFQQTANEVIPDANPTGLFSTIAVGGLSGSIQNITVTLDITNGFNGDLFAYLSFDSGYAVLLNRVGVTDGNAFGYSDTGFDVTFDDSADYNNIHLYQNYEYQLNGIGQLTGTWSSDGRDIDPQSDPSRFDTTSPTATLDSFDNLDPNGTWTFFVADMASGYQSTLVNWGITIITVPEPTTIQFLVTFGGLAAAGGWWRRRKKF
jgi:subtilisin-like proprotein convertase family protein